MKSESQHKKHPGGRKPKFDYRGEEFLSQVETYAKKGFTDREIAFALGLNPTYFYEMKSKYSEITDVLARGRATITAAVRAKFLAVALGGIKTKSTVVRKLKDQDGNLCSIPWWFAWIRQSEIAVYGLECCRLLLPLYN